MHAARLHAVEKTFGTQRAVAALDLEIPQGQTCGLIGPSGAGKSTAIRIIMAILFPDSGEVEVLGRRSALEAKDRIGYLPEERGVYRKMTVGAFLRYLAGLKGVADADVMPRARALLGQLGLEDVEKKKCEDLSKGMLQRVQFVASIVHQPQLLILDEPFSGLDPVSVRLLKEVIAQEKRRGATILFSTHVMAQAEELCDRVVMIHKGSKVLDEPIGKLKRRFDSRRVLFEPLDPEADGNVLRALPGVVRVTSMAGVHELHLTSDADAAVVMRDAMARLVPARVEVARLRLEDIFVDIVRGRGGDSEQALREHLQGLTGSAS